jgi:indolepyruvate ferredoxin oxidoreductase alpha subunit
VKQLLSGNEAIARGAIEAGVKLASAYPGTPSTEILENIAKYEVMISEWAPNEKVALDVAIGGAYAGARTMAVMKHVGLNVAADSLFYASMTGIEAGLVIVCADDPAMHSSQNEQDSRRYCKFARVPCLEPSDSQEAKDLVGIAFSISEEFDVPVLIRLTTRISHSYTLVSLDIQRETEIDEPRDYRIDRSKYVMVPGNARKRHPVIENRILKLTEFAETFDYNRWEKLDRSIGIVTNGISYQYVKEIFPNASILKLGMTYPLPVQLVREFFESVDRLVVVEELDPFLEEEIKLMGLPVEGRAIFPGIGEFNPGTIRDCAARSGLVEESGKNSTNVEAKVPKLPMRPPLLCPGCPHRGVFTITNKLGLVVNGDIGCYTLGFLPPLSALHTCGCMGASIGVAHGAQKVGINQKNVAVLGDSTFFHTGMAALLNTAYNQGNIVTIILDNRTTAMTGHQDNPATGKDLSGKETIRLDFQAIAKSMGIQHTFIVDPYDQQETESALREALAVDSPAVVVAERACALLPEARKDWIALKVNSLRCNGCGLCLRIGCPAILQSESVDQKTKRHLVNIDPLLCTGCEICAQICAREAILKRDEMSEKREA